MCPSGSTLDFSAAGPRFEPQMFQAGAKYSTDNVKCSTEVLNLPRTMSNVPRRCYMFHVEGQMIHIGAKYSTERVKYFTEVLNIPRRGSNVPRRC